MRFQQTKLTVQEIGTVPARIERALYEPLADLQVTAWLTEEPVPWSDRERGRKVALRKGDSWGGLFDCAWFRFTGSIPEQAAGRDIVVVIDLSGEGLVVDGNGNPRLGLTTAASWYDFTLGYPGKRIVPLRYASINGRTIDFWIDAGNNDLFGNLQNNGTLQEAHVALRHADRIALFYDYTVLHDLFSTLPEHSPRRARVLYALWKAKQALTDLDPGRVHAAREALRPELTRRNGDPPLTFSAIGHAHMDLAWLWPQRETVRKGARTFATALDLMDRYPAYHFCASQSQLYQWMKDHYPSLYARMKERIADGRWDVLAATWVEPDTNATCGESLVRQLLYGKRFAKKEFGTDVRVLFLPDTFGYSAVLPQLMKKAGIDYFVTTKMSWDRYNAYPHHTFLWEGIDGSSVLAHMPPEGTYNSAALPSSIRKAETEFQDKAVSSHALLVYGIGDGGGGPGIEHLERLQREENLEGLPPVRQEPVTRFLERLKGERDLLHTWHGELYLACHQGTYTTQGRNKRYNRLMEVGLRELELSAVLAELLAADPYPAERIEELWKETLLYQFHDILPGSSITRVYKDTGRRYPVLLAESASLTRKAIGELAGRVNTRTAREPALVINPFSWNRREWVRSGDRWLFVEAPPVGYVVIDAASTPHIPPVSAGPFFLENEFLRVTIAEDGSITSVFDREQEREVLAGPGNILTVYHDPGDAWDFAWDYEYRVLGRFGLCSAESAVNGPRGEVTLTFGYGASTLVQTVSLKAGSRVLEFDTRADWQERGAMLRASFAVDVRADEATCGIQFGWIKRPTHRSTSWDASKYEIPAQQWIDLSQRNRGVAILKENKYGHRVAGNMLDIHLLRGPSYPDPEADRGEHEFRYGLFPHPGDHITGGVIRAAAEFNAPLRLASCVAGKGHLPASFSLVTVDAQNVFVEAVKRGEEGKGIIVRLSESWGADVRSKVHFGMAVVSAAVTDLLEENPVPLDVSGDSVTVELRPFDVVTLVVVPRSYPGETGSIPAGV